MSDVTRPGSIGSGSVVSGLREDPDRQSDREKLVQTLQWIARQGSVPDRCMAQHTLEACGEKWLS